MKPIKHMIQCHCMLPQYRNRADPVFHKFTVFGCIDDSDTLQTKYSRCNNCNAVHKVYDICKSEIMTGREEMRSIITIDDLTLQIPNDLCDVLESYDCDVPTYEYVYYVILNKAFDEEVVLSRDVLENEVIGKKLLFNKDGTASIR